MKQKIKSIAVFATIFALSQLDTKAKAPVPDEVIAWGCEFSGSIWESCRHGGYSVLNCYPGETSCAYDVEVAN